VPSQLSQPSKASYRSAMAVLSGTLAVCTAALYPRCDLWLTLAVTQLVSIGSLYTSSSSNIYDSNAPQPQRIAVEVAALTLSSLSFALSFLVGVGYFHRPFREYLTTIVPPNSDSSIKKLRELATVEQPLSLFLLVLVSIQSGLVLWPSSTNGSYLAVAGSEIWNTTLFYATWIGLYGAAYLTATVSSMNCNGKDDVVYSMKLWCMVLFSSTCASATLLILHSGPMCQGMALAETTYCSSSLTAGVLGFASAVLSFLGGSYLLHSTRRNRGWRSSRTRWIGLLCASLILGIHSIIVTLVSSPSGPGNQVGSVFQVSWLTWIFSVLLWKSCIESFFVSPAPVLANLKFREKSHKRRVTDVSMPSGGTIIDDESGPQNRELDVVEEDNEGSDSEYAESKSTVSHTEIVHSLEESNSSNHYYPHKNSRNYRRNATDYYSPTHGFDDSDYSTAYYSGSQAVRVRTGSQEEVITLGGTSDRTSWTPDHEDPGGMRGSMLTGRGGTSHHQSRNDKSEPPAANIRLILQEPLSHNIPGPFSGIKNKTSESSPGVYCNSSQFTDASMDVDKEWDFDIPAPQTQPVTKTHTYTPPARATPMATTTIPTATVDKQQANSLRMSICSTIQETSQEGSQGTGPKRKTELTTKNWRARSSIGPTTKSGSTNRSRKRWTPKTARRKLPPPQPPRPIHGKKNQEPGAKRDDSGVASSIPVILGGRVSGNDKKPRGGSWSDPRTAGPTLKLDEFMTSKEKVKQVTPSTDFSDSVSSSSLDFDTAVSDSELTQEEFDVPSAMTRLSASAAATIAATKVDTKEAADNCNSYKPSSLRKQVSSQSHPLPDRLPKRMPLYSASDAPSPRIRRKSHSNSDSQQELRGQEHPSVEAFFARAMKNARLSRSNGNMDDMPPTTDVESSVDRHQQHKVCRKSGGVNGSISISGRAQSHVPSSSATVSMRRESMNSCFSEDKHMYSTPGGDYFC